MSTADSTIDSTVDSTIETHTQRDSQRGTQRDRGLVSTDDAYSGQVPSEGPKECIGSFNAAKWMNLHAVDTLHARPSGFCWGVCNRNPAWHYNATRKNLPRDLYVYVWIGRGMRASSSSWMGVDGWVYVSPPGRGDQQLHLSICHGCVLGSV